MFSFSRFSSLTLLCLAGFLVLSPTLVKAQTSFPMRHVDDVGHLGTEFDSRKSFDLGVAHVVLESEDVLRFDGKDRNGKPWHLWMGQVGGFGTTEVWTADFDNDGQPDVLIDSYGGENGRCIGHAALTVLLFDKNGRPVPWNITTFIPDSKDDPSRPVLLMDQNHDHRAEFVITGCEYSDPGKHNHFGEDHGIIGVYEARDARMIPLRKAPIAPYSREAKRVHPSPPDEPGYITWVPTNPKEWPDQLSGFESPAHLKLKSLIPGEEDCSRIPAVSPKNYKPGGVPTLSATPSWWKQCDELHHPHALFSDGKTRRFANVGDKYSGGAPWVVIDSPASRDIYLIHVPEVRRRIMTEGYDLRLLGDDSEPSWIWVETNDNTFPAAK